MQQLEALQAAGLEPDALKIERERRQDQEERDRRERQIMAAKERASQAAVVQLRRAAGMRRHVRGDGAVAQMQQARHDANVKAKARARRKAAKARR